MEPSPPTLQLRGARSADAVRIAQCYLASCKTLHDIAPITRSEADVVSWVRDELLAKCRLTVAIDAGGVAGFVAVAERVDGPWIEALYVHPSRLHRGVGSTLLHMALMRLDGTVRLYTFEDNRRARRFFERYGFAAVAFGDGSTNDRGRPDVLYERAASP